MSPPPLPGAPRPGRRPDLRGRRLLGSLLLLVAGCSSPVAASLVEDDANRILVALERAGVAGEKEVDPGAEGRFRVLVARDDVGKAVAALRDEDLPPRASPGVLDVVGKSSLVPSLAVEHAQFTAALAGDLERTLATLDGVTAARVHVSLPQPSPLADREPPRATASVLLKHRGATAPLDAAAVQRLVAGAVAGMQPADVTVVLVPRHTLPPPPGLELARLGPLTVTRGSVGYLRGLVALALLLGLAPTAALLLLWRRSRRALAAALNAPPSP